MRRLLFSYVLLTLIIVPNASFGWGNFGHLSISSSAVECLPVSMETVFRPYKSWIASTSTDNGVRTSWDPNESNFHYIDLGGTRTGSCQWPFTCMPSSQSAFLSQYGYSSIGFNCYIVDSLTVVLSTAYQNWNNNKTGSNLTTAMIWMCRIAHYVEDLHQPLHVNWNYNPGAGGGVHSRYESTMLETFTPSVASTIGSGAIYQSNPLQFAFSIVSVANPYGPVIAAADTAAQTGAGGSTSSGTYYTLLWSSTQSFTTTLLNLAAKDVASIWYTAWVNAGITVPVEISDFSSYAMEMKNP